MSTETAEEFQPLPGADNAALDAQLARPPRTFHGKRLAPYGLATEGIMREALVGVRGDELYALTFLRVLVDLEANYQKYRADGWGGEKTRAMAEDDAIDAAAADVFAAVHDNLSLFRAKANGWRVSLKRAGVAEAVALVDEIVKEARDTEVVPAESSPPTVGK